MIILHKGKSQEAMQELLAQGYFGLFRLFGRQSGKSCVKLVPSSELETARKDFEGVQVFIYCVAKDSNLLNEATISNHIRNLNSFSSDTQCTQESMDMESFSKDVGTNDEFISNAAALVNEIVSDEQANPNCESNGNKRRKRKVKKQRTFTDDRGYLVKEDVYEWDSFSEEEEAPPAKKTHKSKPEAPKKLKAVNANGKQKQSSLLNYFSKK